MRAQLESRTLDRKRTEERITVGINLHVGVRLLPTIPPRNHMCELCALGYFRMYYFCLQTCVSNPIGINTRLMSWHYVSASATDPT